MEWFFLEKVICMNIIRSAELINMMYFIFDFNISRVIDENVRKMAKNGDFKT